MHAVVANIGRFHDPVARELILHLHIPVVRVWGAEAGIHHGHPNWCDVGEVKVLTRFHRLEREWLRERGYQRSGPRIFDRREQRERLDGEWSGREILQRQLRDGRVVENTVAPTHAELPVPQNVPRKANPPTPVLPYFP